MLKAMRWICLLVVLSAGAQAAGRYNAAAIEALLRWDIAAFLPDARGQTQDVAPRITELRSFQLLDEADLGRLLVCATLIFNEPETEPTGVALIYALGPRTGPRPLGTPFFLRAELDERASPAGGCLRRRGVRDERERGGAAARPMTRKDIRGCFDAGMQFHSTSGLGSPEDAALEFADRNG